MPAFNRVDTLGHNLATKQIDFELDTFSWRLTNTAPTAAYAFASGITGELATGGGYTLGTGMAYAAGALTATRTGAATAIGSPQIQLLATAAVGPFSYIVLVDNTPATEATRPVTGWVDVRTGGTTAITLAANDTFTIPITSNIVTVG